MKKTISIHIMGSSFIIEEDAYELLNDYLRRLKISFENTKGSEEIIEDIELRIAELAAQYLNEKKQVLTLIDIQAILRTLGNPDEFEMEEEEKHTAGSSQKESFSKSRKLYRDTQNKMISGVCSGIAAYFDVDVVWIRLLFAALLFIGGFIVPVYLVLIWIVPEAKTPAQRLEMQGRPINVENLKNEFNNAAEKIKKETRQFGEQLKDRNSNIRRQADQLSVIFKRIFGIALLVFSFFILLSFLGVLFIDSAFIFQGENTYNFKEVRDLISVDAANSFYFSISMVVLVICIIISMTISGICLLFNFRSKWITRANVSLTVLSVLSIIVFLFQGIRLGTDFAVEGKHIEKAGVVSAPNLEIKTLKSGDLNYITSKNEYESIIGTDQNRIYNSDIEIEYNSSPDSTFQVFIEKEARGKNLKAARTRGKNIITDIRIEGNQLIIDPVFQTAKRDKFRFQNVKISILIPQNKSVYTEKGVFTANDKYGGVIDKYGEYQID